MDPRLSMNTFSGPVNQEDLARRAKEYAAQRAAYEASAKPAPSRDVNAVGADYDSGPHGGALYSSGYVEPMVPSVYAEAGRDARLRREHGGHIPMDSERGVGTHGRAPLSPEQREAAIQAQEDLAAHLANEAVRSAMYKDKPLADALSARLAGFVGEGGRSEGAVEALDRLLAEIRASRKHLLGRVYSWTPNAVERILNDLEVTTRALEEARAKRQPSLGEPGKMFSLETILAIFRAEKARMKASYTHEVEARTEVVDTFIAIFENLE